MKQGEISIKLDGFLQLQGLCVLPIIAVWAIFWAIDRTVNLPIVFAYVLIQVNFTFLLLKPLEFLYRHSKALFRWPAFLVVLFLVTSGAVSIATAAAYWVDGAPGSFAAYLKSAWNFPFVGNALFWTGHAGAAIGKWRRAHGKSVCSIGPLPREFGCTANSERSFRDKIGRASCRERV